MQRLTVRHVTTYRYRQPVTFNEHRLMIRPRDSHDLRLLDATLSITPAASLSWRYDVFGNSVAVAAFEEPAETLTIDSKIVIDRYPLLDGDFSIEPYAKKLPFSYPQTERPDLGRTNEQHYEDPDRIVATWARDLLDRPDINHATEPFLLAMTQEIRRNFRYKERYEPGVQTAVETYECRSGTCRDFAVLMMEAVRSVGLAARFVSGYLYDPALDGTESDVVGAGSTHAWVQVYLPGAGWVEFDPTNGTSGGHNLVPVAVAREPSQAIPIDGSYNAPLGVFIDMQIDVTVRSLNVLQGVA